MISQELIERVKRLEAHVTQLRNVIRKNKSSQPCSSSKDHNHQRDFDFSKYNKRHIALKLLYLGWEFNGFVVQEDTTQTVEHYLFEALVKTKLIESRESSNYHRCGRTDSGVSAFSQVISLDVRSNLTEGKGVIKDSKDGHCTNGNTDELNYSNMLNKTLPSGIRCVAWAPVDQEFSARFNCLNRSYKYFFPKGNLKIELMEEAAQHLIGEHDFRNFCKPDPNVDHSIRNIMDISIVPFSADLDGYQMMVAKVTAKSFLWHQIRYLMAILFMVGQEKEKPNIVSKLLNVELLPKKPQYALASGLPLIFFECNFSEEVMAEWVTDDKTISDLVFELQSIWSHHMIKTQMIRSILNHLTEENHLQIDSQQEFLIQDKTRKHISLEKRQVCSKSLNGPNSVILIFNH